MKPSLPKGGNGDVTSILTYWGLIWVPIHFLVYKKWNGKDTGLPKQRNYSVENKHT